MVYKKMSDSKLQAEKIEIRDANAKSF
uniref:Uncharacterized protein n=1 Tax=Rhizophora mucronata TaxID=61149 RepID=A0A2P2MWV0_RHIMU